MRSGSSSERIADFTREIESREEGERGFEEDGVERVEKRRERGMEVNLGFRRRREAAIEGAWLLWKSNKSSRAFVGF